MKRLKGFLLIFFAGVIIRIIYTVAAPNVFYNVDSTGYYTLGMVMIQHPTIASIITPYRMPLYPLFMNAVLYLVGRGGASIGSPAFFSGIQVVALIQMLIGAISFAVFYRAVWRLLGRWSGKLFAVFLLLDFLVIGWERTLLTEGLAVSLSLVTTAALISLLFHPTKKNFFLVWVWFVISLLLRPAFLLIPFVTLPIVVWYYRKRKVILFFTAFTLIAYVVVPLAYARVNYTNYGYFGIQFVGDIDLLGRILETRVPVSSAKTYPYFYQAVTEYEAHGGKPHPFRFLEAYDPDIYGKPYRFVELAGFTRTVVWHTLPQFVWSALTNIPKVLLEVCPYTLVPWNGNLLTHMVWVLERVYGLAQYLTLAVPVFWIGSVILCIAKPSKSHLLLLLIGTIATSQIFLTALLVYKDVDEQYGRVLSVVQPQMFLFLLMGLSSFPLLRRGRRQK